MDRAYITRAYAIMGLLLLARVFFAAYPPMGVDETYAVAAARGFSLSFFDHPPVAFNAAMLASVLTGIEHPFVFRLPTLIFGTIGAWFIWQIGLVLGGARAGFWTLLLYALSPAFALSGAFIVPDGPLNMGAAICVYWLVRIAQQETPAPIAHWVWVGLGLAFALASKYQAALIPVMTLGFAICFARGRAWFTQPGPYAAAILGLFGLAPTLIWNLQNDWASFAFHSARTGDGVNLDNFAVMFAGQLAYLLPPIAFLAVRALWRYSARNVAPEQILLALISLAPIVAFNAIYLFSEKSFPHWTMPGWLFALPLAGLMVAEGHEDLRRRSARWVGGFAIVVFAGLTALVFHLQTGFLTKYAQEELPAWDRTWDAFDYSGLQPELEARGLSDGLDVIAGRSWIQASYMSTALRGAYPVKILRGNPHHFPFVPGADATGRALLLTPDVLGRASWDDARLLKLAQRTDPNAKVLEPIILQRGGRDYVRVSVIEMEFTSP